MSSDVKVKGLTELQRALNTLPARLEANVMRGALRAGARVLQAEARAHVPVGAPSERNARLYGGRAGLLRDSIRVSVSLKRGTVMARVVAGGKVKGGGDAYYATMVEKGTKPHLIKAAKGKALAIGGGAYRSVMHPGAAPHPFMVPAFDASNHRAVVAAAEYVRKRLASKHGIDVPAPSEGGDE